MRQDLNLEQQEDDYKDAREHQIQEIMKLENLTYEVAAQKWEDLYSSGE